MHAPAQALAPGPTLLQHQRTAELQLLASGGPGRPRVHAGVCRRLASRPVADAALIHGDDIRHAPRRWKTSPDFPGLTETLPAGGPMDHTLFPLLLPRGVRGPEAPAHTCVMA